MQVGGMRVDDREVEVRVQRTAAFFLGCCLAGWAAPIVGTAEESGLGRDPGPGQARGVRTF